MTNYSNEFGMRDYANSSREDILMPPPARAAAKARSIRRLSRALFGRPGFPCASQRAPATMASSRHCARQNNPPAASFDAGPGYSAQPSRPARAEGKPWEKVIAKISGEAGLSMRRPTGAGDDGGSPYSARQNNPPAASFDAGPGYSA